MTHIETAREAILDQSKALRKLADNMPADFSKLINHILSMKGRVIMIGIGKSSYIAKKIAASLASTGTPAFFIHPSEASHGDLGMITKDDMVIFLSNSGETKELLDSIDYCKSYGIKIASITMNENSTLAKNSDFLLNIPKQKETSSIAAPTTSALMTLSIGDAIVTTLHDSKNFSQDDFRIFHPGGKIGANLLKVSDIMRSGNEIPLIYIDDNVTNAIITMTEKCLGCVLVIKDNNKILGIITDGDLRRNMQDNLSVLSIKDLMNEAPTSISKDILAKEALEIMNKKSITTLPVIDNCELVGVIHIHDILRAGID